MAFGASLGGGATPATLHNVCGIAQLKFVGPGAEGKFTCGSVTLQILTGPVTATLFGDDGTEATVTLGDGFGLTFDPATLEVTAPASNPGAITLFVEGAGEVTVGAGTTGSVPVPFDPFDVAKAEVELGPEADDNEFEVEGSFTLGASSDGIDPVTEEVTVQVGTLSLTIPAGSFELDDGEFKFEGVIDGVTLEVEIEPQEDGTLEFEIEGEGADLTGITNPVEVGLAVGDDAGTTAITAELEEEEEEEEEEED